VDAVTKPAVKKIKAAKSRPRFSFLIFLTCLLLTISIWDHYFNSSYEIDRDLVSNLLLFAGTLFSVSAGLFTYSLEQSRTRLAAEVAARTAELSLRNEELEKAFREVKTLRGFLPICAACKKVKNVEGYWQEVEAYVEAHSDASFSHGFCGDCMGRLYPEYRGAGKARKGPSELS